MWIRIFGGPVARQPWMVRPPGGEVITEGSDAVGRGRARSPLDYFLATFLRERLIRMSSLTSTKHEAQGIPPTTSGELLKFIGILILATRFEFGSRAELWSATPRTRLMPAPAFGSRTGMP